MADSNLDLVDQVVEEMRGPNGLSIKTRKWMLKHYEKVFVGKDAVSWIVKNNYAEDRAGAVELGNLMLELKIFNHVTNDHSFKDEGLFYRFRVDDPDFGSNESLSSWKDFLPRAVSGDNHSVLPNIPHGFVDEAMGKALDELEVKPLDEHNLRLLDNVHPPKWENPEPRGSYNLVVIGGGSAGLVTAVASAGLGAKVALIEKHLFGGDCLNVGCVPSKALIRSAHAVAAVRDGGVFGVKVKGEVEVDFGAIMERLRRLRADISPHDSAQRFKDLGIDVFIGSGKFIGKRKVEVDGKVLKFTKACIATGARAAIPPIPGLSDVPYLTNSTVFNLTSLPKRLAVIGAGAIGCELAQCFRRFGSEVYLMARSPHIMAREDERAAQIVEASFEKDGIHLYTGITYKKVTLGTENSKVITVIRNQKLEEVTVDAILVATGRSPNVEGLNLPAAGVKYDNRTGVHVSDTLQTSNKNVYAAGDICTQYKFTHMSDSLARIVIRNALFFGNLRASSLVLPWCTYTDPEVAHVGLYAKDCQAQGIKYHEFERNLADVDRAILDGETEGFVKILVKQGTDKIIGATIVASHAGDMISEITTAMVAGFGLSKMAAVIHPYPTQAEAIRQLGDAFNRTKLTPMVKVLFRKLFAARR